MTKDQQLMTSKVKIRIEYPSDFMLRHVETVSDEVQSFIQKSTALLEKLPLQTTVKAGTGLRIEDNRFYVQVEANVNVFSDNVPRICIIGFGEETSRTIDIAKSLFSGLKNAKFHVVDRANNLSFDHTANDKLILVYPLTYKTMSGKTKMWLEANGRELKNKEIMAIGVGGTYKNTFLFEADFFNVTSGIGAKTYLRNTLVVEPKDMERAVNEMNSFIQ